MVYVIIAASTTEDNVCCAGERRTWTLYLAEGGSACAFFVRGWPVCECGLPGGSHHEEYKASCPACLQRAGGSHRSLGSEAYRRAHKPMRCRLRGDIL